MFEMQFDVCNVTITNGNDNNGNKHMRTMAKEKVMCPRAKVMMILPVEYFYVCY